MIIGVLKEIKPYESRVILTPTEVSELHACGHQILIQSGAGSSAGFPDEAYTAVGAEKGSSDYTRYAEADEKRSRHSGHQCGCRWCH